VFLIALFNLFLLVVLQGDPVAILAMSAMGYVFVFGIALFAYVKANRDPELRKLDRPYRAPRGWVWVAVALGLMQIPLLLIGAIYINNLEYGAVPTVIGFAVLAVFFPLWIYSQNERHKLSAGKQGRTDEKAEPN
jgi:hypothetical protein